MKKKLTLNNNLAISVKNITKTYKLYDTPRDRLKEALNPFKKKYHKSFHALKNVSFDVKKGEILGIVGRNGAGKSTLLEIITGVLSQTSGNVQTNGKITALLSLGIGFNPELTGIENIHFNGAIQGYSKKELDARLEDILDFAEIGDFAYQPIKVYSSGMRARLGFAVAISTDPEIVIVDEALAVGDELFKRKCYARLEQIMKAGKTVLFVTHGVATINQLCTKAILIDKGELILEGSPKLVTTHYQKYLFANKEDQSKVRNEIIALNDNESIKLNFDCDIEPKDDKNVIRENKQIRQKPYLLPGFKSKSKVTLKNYDIDIYDIKLFTLKKEEVNVLVTDDPYILFFKIKFNKKIENVFSSIIFKTNKGIRLGSDVAPGRDVFIDNVSTGDTYLFEWKFTCRLLKGTYYIDINAQSNLNKEFIILSSIRDAIVFKVQKYPEMNYKGIVHLDQNSKISLLS